MFDSQDIAANTLKAGWLEKIGFLFFGSNAYGEDVVNGKRYGVHAKKYKDKYYITYFEEIEVE